MWSLVTGDGDLVPLVRALMKHGIRVAIVYFEYQPKKGKPSFANERLLSASNYALNINELETDRKTVGAFRGLFRQPEKGKQEILLPEEEIETRASKG